LHYVKICFKLWRKLREISADARKNQQEVSCDSSMPLKRLQIKLPRLRPIKLQPDESEGDTDDRIELEPNQQVLIPSNALPLMPALTPAPPLRLITPPAQPPPPTPLETLEVPSLQPMAKNSSKLERTLAIQSMGEDEFTYFGLSVAAQLRSMPLPSAMIMQAKIQYMLSTERRRIGGDTTEANLFA